MRRRKFLAGALAAGASLAARPASATGGLDDFTPPPSPTPTSSAAPSGAMLRVLLGRGDATAIDPQTFRFGARTYRGTFSLTPAGEVVSSVPLEHYLYSVVPMESPHTWPEEALRAQAIVARTYALSRSNAGRAYDVVASERDQAYGGLQGEYPESTAAVDATAEFCVGTMPLQPFRICRAAAGTPKIPRMLGAAAPTFRTFAAWRAPIVMHRRTIGGLAT